MESAQEKYTAISQRRQCSVKIHTTLYELIETVIEVADPEESQLVNQATVKLLAAAKPHIRVV